MRVSNVALAAVLTLSVDFSQSQSASSKYTYKPDGAIFNGEFLPGPNQWEGQCNDGSVEQSPIAIVTNDWAVNSDIETEDYSFHVSQLGLEWCSYCQLAGD